MAHGMIVAPQPEAVEAGAEMLRNGGNAVDAAIACALVQGVVDPMMAGIAGFGSMQVYSATSDVIDVSNRVPRSVTRELEQQGYTVARSYLSYAFAAVHAIKIDGGTWTGGADPGHDGMALAV